VVLMMLNGGCLCFFKLFGCLLQGTSNPVFTALGICVKGQHGFLSQSPSFGYCVIVVVLRSRDASTGGIHHLQEHALFKTAIQTGAGCALKDEPVLVSAISMTVVSLLFIWGTTARFSDSGK